MKNARLEKALRENEVKRKIVDAINGCLEKYMVSIATVCEGKYWFELRIPSVFTRLSAFSIYVTEKENGYYLVEEEGGLLGKKIYATISEGDLFAVVMKLAKAIEFHIVNAEAENAFNKVCTKLMALGFESDGFN